MSLTVKFEYLLRISLTFIFLSLFTKLVDEINHFRYFFKKTSAVKFLFIKVPDKLVTFWDYPNRYWAVASVMDKKEQNPFRKGKRTTPNMKNV